MAWIAIEINCNGKTFAGSQHTSRNEWSFPYFEEVTAGDMFTVGDKTYVIEQIVDYAGRNEQLLIGGKEVKNVKSKAGRIKPDDGE